MKKRILALLVVAMLLFSMLAGCSGNGEAYKAATASMEAGDYEAAAEAFTALGSYQDAATLAGQCYYEAGMAQKEAGEYEAAAALFEKAGAYEDAAAQAFAMAHVLDADAFVAGVNALLTENDLDSLSYVVNTEEVHYYEATLSGTTVAGSSMMFNHYEDGEATDDGYLNQAVCVTIFSADVDSDTMSAYLTIFYAGATAQLCTADPVLTWETGSTIIDDAVSGAVNAEDNEYVWEQDGFACDLSIASASGYVLLMLSVCTEA